MKYPIQKNTVQETLVIPLYGKCVQKNIRGFSGIKMPFA